ncbi:MAG: LysR family transcriptional regulator [Xanthobacteraceae bacterium]
MSSSHPTGRRRGNNLRQRVRWRQLELLAALEHAQTLSAAAREVRLSQPAASKLLRALGEDLSIELFERAGRTVRPTLAGRALIRHAAGLVGNLDRAQSEIDAIRDGLTGLTSIGAGVGACYALVPQALALLLDQAPGIFVTLREGPMEELFAMLREGRLDMVVGRVDSLLIERDLVLDELYDPPIKIVAGPRHPFTRLRRVTWGMLVDQEWILPQAGTPMRAGIEAIFRRAPRRPMRCQVESSSIQTNVSLLGARNMLWVLSADIAAHFDALGLLKAIPTHDLRGPAALAIVRLRGRALSPSASRLAGCLHTAAKDVSSAYARPSRSRGRRRKT